MPTPISMPFLINKALQEQKYDEVCSLLSTYDGPLPNVDIYIMHAASSGSIEFMQTILSRKDFVLDMCAIKCILGRSLAAPTVELLEYLLDRLPLPENIYSELLIAASSGGHLKSLKFLLKQPQITIEDVRKILKIIVTHAVHQAEGIISSRRNDAHWRNNEETKVRIYAKRDDILAVVSASGQLPAGEIKNEVRKCHTSALEETLQDNAEFEEMWGRGG